jgi:hypothetical protein
MHSTELLSPIPTYLLSLLHVTKFICIDSKSSQLHSTFNIQTLTCDGLPSCFSSLLCSSSLLFNFQCYITQSSQLHSTFTCDSLPSCSLFLICSYLHSALYLCYSAFDAISHKVNIWHSLILCHSDQLQLPQGHCHQLLNWSDSSVPSNTDNISPQFQTFIQQINTLHVTAEQNAEQSLEHSGIISDMLDSYHHAMGIVCLFHSYLELRWYFFQ